MDFYLSEILECLLDFENELYDEVLNRQEIDAEWWANMKRLEWDHGDTFAVIQLFIKNIADDMRRGKMENNEETFIRLSRKDLIDCVRAWRERSGKH